MEFGKLDFDHPLEIIYNFCRLFNLGSWIYYLFVTSFLRAYTSEHCSLLKGRKKWFCWENLCNFIFFFWNISVWTYFGEKCKLKKLHRYLRIILTQTTTSNENQNRVNYILWRQKYFNSQNFWFYFKIVTLLVLSRSHDNSILNNKDLSMLFYILSSKINWRLTVGSFH